MKKTILSKLTLTVVVCLVAISNVIGQSANPTGTYDAIHSILVGSEYDYNVVLNQTNGTNNVYTWKVLNTAGDTELDVIAINSTNVQTINWSGAYAIDGAEVILQVEEFGDHGDGATCLSISQIQVRFTNTLPSIVMQTPDNAICSMEATSVVVKFNGIAPWDITLTDDQSVVTVSETNITMAQVTDIGGGFYTYTFNINAGILDATAGDVTHNLKITSFVDDNVRKNASLTNGDLTGDVEANVTVHQLPQISTINHN